MSIIDNSTWLESKKAEYPWMALAPSTIRPEDVLVKVYGHHASASLTKFVRTYMFKTKQARDLFVKDYDLCARKPPEKP